MQSWRAVRAAAVVVMVGAWLGLSSPGYASNTPLTGECDALVVDAAEELSADEESAVGEAAATLRTETAFEPRVWVLTQAQDGFGLEDWLDGQEEACPSWIGDSGVLRSNFIVLAVTTDDALQSGETGLWFGDALPADLDSSWTEIQSDVINPALRDGDYARGLTDGLAAVGDVIDPGPPVGWIVAGGVVLVGAAGFGVYRWRRMHLERVRARAALAQRFEAAAAGSDQAVLQLDPLAETIDSDIQLVRGGFHEDEAETQLADVTELLATYATLTSQRLDLAIARDQVLKDADDARLAEVVTAWEELRAGSEELLPALARERDELAAALALSDSIPTRVAAVPAAVDLVRRAERTARELGFAPSTEVAPLASVPSRVSEAQRLAADRRYLAADAELTGVETDLEDSRSALATLPERLEELTGRIDAAAARRMGLSARIDAARAAETTLVEQFNPAIAAEVGSSSSTALDQCAHVDAALADARAALGIRDLGAVATAVIAAEDGLGQADAAAASPGALLERVRRLATDLPTALAGVRTTLEALRARARPATAEEAALLALQARAGAITLTGQPNWPRLDVEVRAIGQAAAEITEKIAAAERAEAQRQAAEAARKRRGPGGGFSFLGGSRRTSSGSSGRSWSGGSSSSRSSSSSSSRGGSSSRSSGGRRGGSSRR